ncbi:hypothetical protein COOONC_11434 [Cooperia oncophora]
MRYPRPQFTNGGFVHLKEDDFRLNRFNSRMRLQSTSSGLRMLFASRKGALDAFEVAKPAMSHTFAKLLHCFSKIIGESELVLYCAFMMLEFHIADKQRATDNAFSRQYIFHLLKMYPTLVRLEVVRLGLPRLWGSGLNENAEDEIASCEYDYFSETSDESDSETTGSSVREDDELSMRYRSPSSSQESVVAADRMLPRSTGEHLSSFQPSISEKRELHSAQYTVRKMSFAILLPFLLYNV